MRIADSPFTHSIDRILLRLLQVWRAGKPWSRHVCQVSDHLHDLRVLRFFIFDSVDCLKIDLLRHLLGPQRIRLHD
jgi:hypothetical protein